MFSNYTSPETRWFGNLERDIKPGARHTLVFTAMKYPRFSEARSRRPFTFSDRNALSCTLAKLQVRRRPKPEKSSSDRNPEGVSPLRLHQDDCYFAFARL
ncbi:hypothetical protein V1478_007457 [Vespula squamosa]|uniref:Uncharacterized protein n=1 Tax=Vespula squamosa TaxID=30214 RepID=A0ABD2B367_VESSQ